jgi:uncharacterized lipoprotein YajG
LFLNDNQIVIFNPTNELPISLIQLALNNNQMTTAGYIVSETWANAQTIFIFLNNVNFAGNPNSVSGTNLETILITKNCNVIP